MKKNNIKHWLSKNKKGLIIGFLIGAFVTPFLATLGLISIFFETIRPILIGPFDLVASQIPDVQIAPNTYAVPAHKWILGLGFNGICYALVGGIIQSLTRKQ